MPGSEEVVAVADYVDVLARLQDATTRAEDRALYDKHLALAGRLLSAIVRDDAAEASRLRELIERLHAGAWLSSDTAQGAWTRLDPALP